MRIEASLFVLPFIFVVYATAIPISKRGLADIFNTLVPQPSVHELAPTPTSHTVVTDQQAHNTGITPTTASITTLLMETGKTYTSTQTHVTTGTEQQTWGASWPTGSTSTTSFNTWKASATGVGETGGYAQDASHMPPGEATEWKVIGITVLCITFVGSIMLAAFFSDTWIGLVKDVCLGGNRRKQRMGEENLVPDWEKRTWEYKLADEEGHRYPSVSASLQSMAKAQHTGQPSSLAGGSPTVTVPPSSYLADFDPHPLDPLFRRPSCRDMNGGQ
ncbi:hypothetical protein AMATHDRAFT_2255 [Amanita thiersii Skay4041]|uniref:Uncharacterized protein n=1 Tax=Amanita thiersii Skay4041 TaxID=703135 RepID=A0A2A9NNY5_9AGAR|nr:hypothetical protein AMATHDRAFT_2255 [Amanita thiersii Skay4041]